MATPAELTAHVPLLPIKQRNTTLDALFYDVASLTAKETSKLSPAVDREGSIVVVPQSGKGEIRHYRKALRFFNNEKGNIKGIAVAGVGSSVLGTAALARNVADAIGGDVAGLVTGYGMTDLMSEALGGWFVFGAADRMRYGLAQAVDQSTATLPSIGPELKASADSTNYSSADFISHMPGTDDVATLSDLLMAPIPGLEVLVGHSKGSLLIDFSLHQFVRDMEGDHHPLYDSLKVVTLGAVVSLPAQFSRAHQFLGDLDWFGGMNSRLQLKHNRIGNAWHHLNRQLPFHMDAIEVVQAAMAS